MSIVNMVTGFATPMVANKIAAALGLPEGATRKVLTAATPLLLAMLLKRGSAPGGTQALGAAISGLGPSPLQSLSRLFQGEPNRQAITAAAQGGGDILGTLYGVGATGTAAGKLADYAGLDPQAATALLGLAGSGVLGGLRQAADDRKLDAAGLLRELAADKSDIAKALPADFGRDHLQGTGLVDESLFAAPATARPQQAASGGGGALRWLLGLVAVVAAAAIAWALLAPKPAETPTLPPAPPASTVPAPTPPSPDPAASAPAASETPAAEPAPAATPPAASTPADQPAAMPPAPTPPAAMPSSSEPAAPPAAPPNPLEVDGVDLGDRFREVLGTLTATLGAVSDPNSARQAVEPLRDTAITLQGLGGQVDSLSPAGRDALHSVLGAALPTLRATSDRLMADAALGPILRPVLADIMTKLNAYAN